MYLYNSLTAAERARLIDEAGQERITLSFYQYHVIPNPTALRDELFTAWKQFEVLGRIYVAHEGINAQLSVAAPCFEAFREHLDRYPFLQGIRLNVAVEQNNKSFLKLHIKVRDKIVADGITDPSFDASKIGKHLKAGEFNELIDSPDTVLVDMRNHYESEIGNFPQAILPDVDTFREALTLVHKDLEPYKHEKNIVMYCTGGIRCEKASAFFKYQGFEKVYQLEGGIIEYLRQVKAEGIPNKFKGKNFVFDERRAEKISDDVISHCHLCGAPSDTHVNCGNMLCNMLFIDCPACQERLSGCCSEECKEFAAIPESLQKAKRQGIKNPIKYFRRSG
jgi:UPF0176 protein